MTTFDPSEIFTLAQSLTQDYTSEAADRNAIGRAYYACFLTARDQMFGLDQSRWNNSVSRQVSSRLPRRSRSRGSHNDIQNALATHQGIRPGQRKRLKDQLGELKDLRIQADYILDPTHSRTTNLHARYGVSGWEGLAHQAMALASNLLPDLRQVPTWN